MEKKSEMYELGMRVRREVLGPEYVDKVWSSTDDFSRDLQDYVTEHVWGAVWGRPGLDRRTRSLITLALQAALGIESSMPRHVEAALRNGATSEEIKEAFLTTAVVAGAPRALDAFRIAGPIIQRAKAQSARG